MPAKRKSTKTSKRTIIEPHNGDRRYVRRNKRGRFKKEVSVGRSLAADRRRKSESKVKAGQGDRGDRGGGIITAVKRVFSGYLLQVVPSTIRQGAKVSLEFDPNSQVIG